MGRAPHGAGAKSDHEGASKMNHYGLTAASHSPIQPQGMK